MSEIYWITRLGLLGETCMILLMCCIIAMFFLLVLSPLIIDTYSDFEEGKKSTCRKVFKFYILLLCLSALGCLFIPTQKQAFLIYGVGGTIDYVKSNDKAKQLPDKCVDALTRYVDSIEKDNKNNNDE